jgi:trk system potassium uptake protein TrkH
MAETAKGLWLVYVSLTVACILMLWALGMSFFDAVVHAFSIMGLGGFSSHDASLGHFDSLPLEIAVGTFALIAGINFATHFAVLRGRSLGVYRHDPEIRWFLGFVLISGLVLALLLWQRDIFLDFPSALRYAMFNTISVATTLGFATTDYGHWPFFAGLWLLFLCSFSTSAGSTGGGIKMMRAMILYRQVYREIKGLAHPNAVNPVKIAGQVVPDKVVFAVLGFFFIWIVLLVSMTLILSLTGLDAMTAFSAVVASLNNIGPGLHQVGPATNFAVLSDFQTWVCSFAMLLGRLELFALLVVFTPTFWRK